MDLLRRLIPTAEDFYCRLGLDPSDSQPHLEEAAELRAWNATSSGGWSVGSQNKLPFGQNVSSYNQGEV